MVLEAVMVVVDNSESSRNGDYQPTRYDAQADAVNVIFQTITNGNPESSVGLMSMGGKGPEVLVTLTTDQGKILDGLHRTKTKIKGTSHLATGIQVAGLALKHRQNKSQRQRIIVFVCSPIEEEEKKLVQLAKKMKKGNVSVDFVLFGDLDDDDTQKKLQAFNESVKGGEGSNLVVIPPSSKLLSDQLISSPILLGDSAGGSSGGGGGGESSGGNFGEFDFDPAMDPELALALRMSMEDEKARQEKKAREEAEAGQKGSLEDIKEEGENAPLLNKDGESSKKNDKKDDDTMDTS
ncbi:von willebrand factor type a domain-containing protein [Colletotrichum incanum]|uniref:von willebrand factor type a domain-containing protein n=1 Tax=Colletotrichum incanum TaxID=1573173 RepID=A0A162NUF1_COLIC|nr:von willebrand factor type a domain-containing protein [Colletotrichum incanum]OHW94292.1 26s proteasome regulatory subunit multiubiquitin chain binding protein [Colletotrichum incanum]